MKYLTLIIVFLFYSYSANSQPIKPKFGAEMSASLKKIDDIASFDSPALSGYVGFYTLIQSKYDRFKVKFGAGINITHVHRNEIKGFFNETGIYPDSIYASEVNLTLYTLSVNVEMRYYLMSNYAPWGNLYASLPLTLESSPFTNSWFFSSEFKVIPSIGYCYNFNKHLGLEVNSGIGWGRYFTNGPYEVIKGRNSMLEYTSSIRICYTF